jgi:1-acyl-sn-glycerol-3-phosphate acyltransferase
MRSFKKGAFVLAIQAGVPIVPVGMIGTHQIMPKGSFRFRPGKIVIHVGEPIQVDGLTNDDRDILRDRTWRAVAELKGEGPAAGTLESQAS